MTTILLAIVVVGLLMLAMAIGVLMGRKPIAGSCGGMKALGMDVECEICGGNPSLCDTSSDTFQPEQPSQSEQQRITQAKQEGANPTASNANSAVGTFDPGHTSK